MRLDLQQRDAELRARYGDRVAVAPDARALVAATGRPLTALPRAWRVPGRLAIPSGGGSLRLPSGALGGRRAASGHAAEAFVVRAIDRPASGRPPGPMCRLAVLGRERGAARARRPPGRAAPPARRDPRAARRGAARGMSAEELCADLHGDGGSPSSVRVEVSRLRKLLGPWIDTERYRLTCDVETDAAARRAPAGRGRRARGGRGLRRAAPARLRGARDRRPPASTWRRGCGRR